MKLRPPNKNVRETAQILFFMSTILDIILESDVVVDEDYYFMEFDYNSLHNNLFLKNGCCVTTSKKKKNLRFDKKSFENATIFGNVVTIFDTKGKKHNLELMDLAPKNIKKV